MQNNNRNSFRIFGWLAFQIIISVPVQLNAQPASVSLETIQKRYKGKWPKSITYLKEIHHTQYGLTQQIKEHHAALFPGLHRTDHGDPGDGNATITRGDSLYRFKKYKNSGRYENNHYPDAYILGDIYYDSIDEAKKQLAKNGLDINKSCVANWEGRKVYILGATNSAG